MAVVSVNCLQYGCIYRSCDHVASFWTVQCNNSLTINYIKMKLSNAALLLLTGVTIGAVAGLLLAPEEGAKTRKKLMKQAKKYQKELEEKAGQFKSKAADLKENLEGVAEDVKKRFS